MERRKYLPIDIVEKIIARMPYPCIFKCRCLSKSWLAKFASTASETNKEKKRIAISFQKQVAECSNCWKTLCPVFSKSNRDFIAYDQISHKWRRLPPLPFPEGTMCSKGEAQWSIQIEGALVYAFLRFSLNIDKYVANILTGVWKKLPVCHDVDHMFFMHKLVSAASSEFYKVIIVCFGQGFRPSIHIGQHTVCVQIYDSELDAWSIKKVVYSFDLITHFFFPWSTVYLNGVLYTTHIQLNLEKGTLEILDVPPTKYFNFTAPRMIASWNGNLLIVLEKVEWIIRRGTGLKALKLDFQSKQLSQLAEISFPALKIGITSGLVLSFSPA